MPYKKRKTSSSIKIPHIRSIDRFGLPNSGNRENERHQAVEKFHIYVLMPDMELNNYITKKT